MRVEINFQRTIDQLKREYSGLPDSTIHKAIARALNRTASSAKSQASKEIRQVYKIGTKWIKDRIKITNAKSGTLEARVWAEGSPIPALAFAKWSKRNGVTLNVKGQRKKLPGAFMATMKSGHQGIFIRSQSSRTYMAGQLQTRRQRVQAWPKSDTPIGEVMSVGVPTAFSNKAVINALEAKARDYFPTVLAHELKFRSGQTTGS